MYKGKQASIVSANGVVVVYLWSVNSRKPTKRVVIGVVIALHIGVVIALNAS